MMLCCLHDGFNGTVGLSLSQVFLESISEDGQLTIGLEATEGFLGLQQAGGGPSERHLGVSPAFDVAGDLAHRAERVLDDVGAGERAPEFVRQAEADDGEDLVQPLQDAARDARFLMLQTPGQVAQQPFGLVCVVLVPGLTERLLDARMQMQGQALDDVTALVDLAALDGGGHTDGVADRFAERLRAIDDEQPGQRRIEPPGEEIVKQGLDDDSVLRRPLDHGQDMLVAVAIDADRRHQDMVADMQTVDLDDPQVELREVRGEPSLHLLARQRHKAPGNGRLRGAVATRFRQVALGQTDRAVVLAGSTRSGPSG